MFLIDSSAWIEYLRPAGSPRAKERVREILRMNAGASCGIVAVEILRGVRNERDFQVLGEALTALEPLPIDNEVIDRAARWGYLLDRKGKSISTTDLLIASAAHGRACLVHIDRDFEQLSAVAHLEQEKIDV